MKRTEMKWTGTANATVDFLLREQLNDPSLWKKFVQQYRDKLDGTDRGWRGEYWGKAMRGACLVYEYTKDEDFYNLLTGCQTLKHLTAFATLRNGCHKVFNNFKVNICLQKSKFNLSHGNLNVCLG
jgi:hypothetical protein